MNETELIAQAMRVLGKRRTDKKHKAAIENVKLANDARRKPVTELDCTCGADANRPPQLEGHAATCPRGRAFRRRKSPTPPPPQSSAAS